MGTIVVTNGGGLCSGAAWLPYEPARSIGQAKLSNVPTINNMPAPSINTLSLTTRGETAAGGGGGGGGGPAQPDGSVAFKLLVKRAGKQ
eukprot:7587528-Pyramimonas_sp.AAC.1